MGGLRIKVDYNPFKFTLASNFTISILSIFIITLLSDEKAIFLKDALYTRTPSQTLYDQNFTIS